ncbi:MAG: NlpC/P60 family protein [Verrucomicrobiota bacterium]
MKIRLLLIAVSLSMSALPAVWGKDAVVASIKPKDLIEYELAPPEIQKLIEDCLKLTKMKLAYGYGTNSPSQGSMDCSGAVQHVIQMQGIKDVPRMSHLQYVWADQTKWPDKPSGLTKVKKVYDTDHPDLAGLRPGHLLFWEGTYDVKKRNPPISHVMIYLGRLKKDGQGVMFGASSGRRFRGLKIHGVSVFDFKVPTKSSKAKFVAYGRIPQLIKIEGAGPAPKKKLGLFKKR